MLHVNVTPVAFLSAINSCFNALELQSPLFPVSQACSCSCVERAVDDVEMIHYQMPDKHSWYSSFYESGTH